MDQHQRLAQFADENGGAFTRKHALAAGWTAGEIRGMLRAGTWIRPHRGVYIDAAEHAVAEVPTRHAMAAAAAALAHPGALASHHTAARLRGWPVLDDDTRIHVTRPGRPRTPEYYGPVVLHAAGHPGKVDWVRRIPTTPVARTIVDLARWSSPLGGLAAADHALRHAATSPEEIRAVLDEQSRWPWAAKAEHSLSLASALSESPGESLSRLYFRERGIDQPAQQVELHDANGMLVARVDFLWRNLRVVGEFDGFVKYTDPKVLRDEKLRQEAIERLGFIVIRWTWRDLTATPAATERRIRAILARASRHS
jgi:hypothetical protein